MAFLGFILIVACVFYGCYANPYWKQFDEAPKYANGIYRAIVGIPAWIMVVCVMLRNWGLFFPCLLITAALLALPFMRLKNDGYSPVKPTFMILMASLGTYARVILAWTIIGLFVTNSTKRAAEVGWDGAAFEYIENMKESEKNGPSITDTIMDVMSTPSEEKTETVNEEKVEVWRMNGMVREDLKVNSDGTMYYDPDDCEWKKINK